MKESDYIIRKAANATTKTQLIKLVGFLEGRKQTLLEEAARLEFYASDMRGTVKHHVDLLLSDARESLRDMGATNHETESID